MNFWFDQVAVHYWLPEGQSGDWSVRRRIVEGDRAEWKRLGMDENGDCSPPGIYTELWQGNNRRMSDDVFLLKRDRAFVENAYGKILLTGLGLGCTAAWLAQNVNVEQVDVIEISMDVIRLVAPHLKSNKLRVIKADAFTFRPNMRYDSALHDCFEEFPVNEEALISQYAPFVSWQGVSRGN